MKNRRNFLKTAITGAGAITMLPVINTYATERNTYQRDSETKPKLRFALASDIHYGQEKTDFDVNTANMVKWLNDDHAQNHLDFVIINGDLVHNRPDLLPEIKTKYLDKLNMPYHTIPGNHDYADAKLWKSVFGYEDKYTLEFGDIAFVLANTASVTGDYVCPDNAFIETGLISFFPKKKVVFVVLHVPPVQWLDSEKESFLNCPETVDVLHKYLNVKGVFHGHDHLLDGVRYTKWLPHFFDSHIGGDWGTDYRGYRVVEISEVNAIKTYQVNASMNPVLNTTKWF